MLASCKAFKPCKKTVRPTKGSPGEFAIVFSQAIVPAITFADMFSLWTSNAGPVQLGHRSSRLPPPDPHRPSIRPKFTTPVVRDSRDDIGSKCLGKLPLRVSQSFNQLHRMNRFRDQFKGEALSLTLLQDF